MYLNGKFTIMVTHVIISHWTFALTIMLCLRNIGVHGYIKGWIKWSPNPTSCLLGNLANMIKLYT